MGDERSRAAVIDGVFGGPGVSGAPPRHEIIARPLGPTGLLGECGCRFRDPAGGAGKREVMGSLGLMVRLRLTELAGGPWCNRRFAYASHAL